MSTSRRQFLQVGSGLLISPHSLIRWPRGPLDDDKVLKGAEAAAAGLATLVADGVQHTRADQSSTHIDRTDNVRLFIRKPNLLRLECQPSGSGSADLIAISDGVHYYVVHPVVQQYSSVTISNIDQDVPYISQLSPGFFSALAGSVSVDPDTTMGGKTYHVRSRSQTTDLGQIKEVFYFGGSSLVEGYSVTSTHDGITTVQQDTWFSDFKINSDVAGQMFQYTPVPGYVLVNDSSTLPIGPVQASPSKPMLTDFTLPLLSVGSFALHSYVQNRKGVILQFVGSVSEARACISFLEELESYVSKGLGLAIICMAALESHDIGDVPRYMSIVNGAVRVRTRESNVAAIYSLSALPELVLLNPVGGIVFRQGSWNLAQVKSQLLKIGF